jgi:hypothetical protein
VNPIRFSYTEDSKYRTLGSVKNNFDDLGGKSVVLYPSENGMKMVTIKNEISGSNGMSVDVPVFTSTNHKPEIRTP